MSLQRCHDDCERFVRGSLPSFKAVAAEIPTIPRFRPEPRRNRIHFVEHTQPNWWQIPKPVWERELNADFGQSLLQSIQAAPPFSNAIGKSLYIPEIGRGTRTLSAEYLSREITVAYLFAAGTTRWKPHAFKSVWKQCLDFFDPAKERVRYVIYAPLWALSGVQRKLSLGEGLEIRRLSHNKMADIASLNNRLAGVQAEHRLTRWASHFFVREFEFHKFIRPEEDRIWMEYLPVDCTSWLNEEAAMLRTLLGHEIAIPTYGFVFDGYPRDGGLAHLHSLPWRPRGPFVDQRFTRKDLDQYARTRARFKSLSNQPGWSAVAASIRRFAVAWENPFPADILTDIIAALEALLVPERTNVGYKLRIRAAHFLAEDQQKKETIIKDIKDGYSYRSRVAHGEFVFDNIREWETARVMERVKVKDGNPFHDVNEIHRLTFTLAGYYRDALNKIILTGDFEIDWAVHGI